jgi:hypothetical protein
MGGPLLSVTRRHEWYLGSDLAGRMSGGQFASAFEIGAPTLAVKIKPVTLWATSELPSVTPDKAIRIVGIGAAKFRQFYR